MYPRPKIKSWISPPSGGGRARRSELVGDGRREPGSAVRLDRPRALVVRGASCRRHCGRSTSTACIPTSASSCRSWSRSSSGAPSVPATACYDPFAGSGTTLVEANVFGARHGRLRHLRLQLPAGRGEDEALLARVELELGLRGALEEARRSRRSTRGASAWLRRWYAPEALGELLALPARRPAPRRRPYADVARVVLSRAARSARLTTHFDLDFPREPVTGPYQCRKHKRECRPVDRGAEVPAPLHRRHARAAARVRGGAQRASTSSVLHADARTRRLRRDGDGHHHLAALPGPHRLPRAAPLRVRAARATRPAGARDRRGRCGPEPLGARTLRRRP